MPGATNTERPYRERCAERRLELDAALARVIDIARSTPDIVRVLLFGSYARDRVAPWSDLDVLVVREAGPPDLVDDLYRAGAGGDVIGVRSQDFPHRLEGSAFGRTILNEGKIVYARAH